MSRKAAKSQRFIGSLAFLASLRDNSINVLVRYVPDYYTFSSLSGFCVDIVTKWLYTRDENLCKNMALCLHLDDLALRLGVTDIEAERFLMSIQAFDEVPVSW
jgi:hypothetical protein